MPLGRNMIVINFILVLLLQCSLKYNKIVHFVYFVNNKKKKILFLELAKIIVEVFSDFSDQSSAGIIFVKLLFKKTNQ